MNTDRSNINLKDLLEYLGEDIILHGKNHFKLREHDSLIISGNKFFWNSKGIGGNYFSLLKELYGLNNKEIWKTTQSFLDAVEYGDFIPSKTKVDKEKIEYKIYEKKNKLDDIKEYLCEKRGINPEFIDSLYYNKLLYMDYKENIIFVIKDKNEKAVGEEIIGTGNIKYRRNTSESKGFNITRRDINKNPKVNNLYVFEGTIDMLSYIQLFQKEINDKWKDENVRFLTLSGLREDIFENYIEDIKNVYVCTDNDVAGDNFFKKLEAKYQDINFYREKSIAKDWNDDLQKLKTKENENVWIKNRSIVNELEM
ncbi:DUF3991 and toprim domain-containing protein [Streptobacillus moniliformis]|uniref:DUF3991 and toprim domain-containing protein n=1 Tax=Streptobacillus moniliformis TaxID=34105 RepID=UPI000A7C7135|nr:DUF3991 and toprim domain-containing protein [Streptobacillus moniliformis]